MYQQKGLEALKQLIQKRGDTQDGLAKALGIHRTTFNYKLNERNGKAFTENDMQVISEYYNIPLDQREALFFE